MPSHHAPRRAQQDAPPAAPTHLRAVVLPRGAKTPALREAPPLRAAPGGALLRPLLTGIDGTDEEVLRDGPAAWPEREPFLVLGHEALAEVIEAPEGSGLAPGERVAPLVRRGCGHCNRCLYGASDLCATQDYLEHGLKGLHGFMRDAWRHDPRGLVRVPRALGDAGAMVEPLSIVVKALDEASRVQRRLPWFEEEGGWSGKRALVAGTGSLGTLAAFLLRDEGMDVLAVDRSGDDAAPARLLADIGARHANVRETPLEELAEEVGEFDLVIEATGAPHVAFDALGALDENGVMCLLGVPRETPPFPVDGDAVMRRMVLGNQVLLGSVNSRRSHFERALDRLASFQRRWGDAIDRVMTHTFRPEDAEAAFAEAGDDMIKKAIDWREDARLRSSGQK